MRDNSNNSDRHRYVLLDRDGVINRRIRGGYVTSWERFQFLPRALEALRYLAEHRYTALVVSNQACVGKGLLSANDLESITRRFLLEVTLAGGNIGQVYYCKHREEDRCSCRKPQPGLIVRARMEHRFTPEETYVIGDSPSDAAAAATIGCPAIMIRRDAFLERPADRLQRPVVTSNLLEAAQLIVALQRRRESEYALAAT